MNYLDGTQKAILAFLKERDASIRFASRNTSARRPTSVTAPRLGTSFQALHLHGSILPVRV